MKCPTCGQELRALQVETMVGNPGYNEWCRNGYCSLDCFTRRDPARKPVAVCDPQPTSVVPPPIRIPARRPVSDEWNSFTLATACLVAVPFSMLIGVIGTVTKAYQHPQTAFGFFVVICLILVAGAGSGVAALFGIPQHGPRGILWRSVLGLALILGFGALTVIGILESP